MPIPMCGDEAHWSELSSGVLGVDCRVTPPPALDAGQLDLEQGTQALSLLVRPAARGLDFRVKRPEGPGEHKIAQAGALFPRPYLPFDSLHIVILT